MMTKIEKAGFASPAGSFSEKPESAKRPLSSEGGYRHGGTALSRSMSTLYAAPTNRATRPV